jgi:hypothetical protein
LDSSQKTEPEIFEADRHNNQTTKFWKKSKTKTWKLIAELKASTTKKKQTNLVDFNSNNKQLNKTLLKETHEAAAATASSDLISRWRNTHYQLSCKWKSHEACDSSQLLLSESTNKCH